tara:strand:- start:899 stop:1258 length:360 start_codon:yes stop_codon:yes gene_type:complete
MNWYRIAQTRDSYFSVGHKAYDTAFDPENPKQQCEEYMWIWDGILKAVQVTADKPKVTHGDVFEELNTFDLVKFYGRVERCPGNHPVASIKSFNIPRVPSIVARSLERRFGPSLEIREY